MTARRCTGGVARTSQSARKSVVCLARVSPADSEAPLEFLTLGPIAVRRDGQELPLGGPKQRALLALLLVHENQVVSRDRLIDGLWGERPPPTAAHTLDNYISRLRKLLGDGRI